MTDNRIIILSLAAISALCIGAIVYLASTGSDTPEALVAASGSSLGALGGYLARDIQAN